MGFQRCRSKHQRWSAFVFPPSCDQVSGSTKGIRDVICVTRDPQAGGRSDHRAPLCFVCPFMEKGLAPGGLTFTSEESQRGPDSGALLSEGFVVCASSMLLWTASIHLIYYTRTRRLVSIEQSSCVGVKHQRWSMLKCSCVAKLCCGCGFILCSPYVQILLSMHE